MSMSTDAVRRQGYGWTFAFRTLESQLDVRLGPGLVIGRQRLAQPSARANKSGPEVKAPGR